MGFLGARASYEKGALWGLDAGFATASTNNGYIEAVNIVCVLTIMSLCHDRTFVRYKNRSECSARASARNVDENLPKSWPKPLCLDQCIWLTAYFVRRLRFFPEFLCFYAKCILCPHIDVF